MKAGLVLGVAALTVANCSRPIRPAPSQAAPDPVVWAPSLDLSSLEALRARTARPFAEPFDVAVVGSDGLPKQATMASCLDYFGLRPKGYEPLAQPDLAAMKIDGATCWTLKALESARPATGRPLGPMSLDQETLSRLPPVLGPMVNPIDRTRRTDAANERKPWNAIDPDAKVVRHDAWSVQVRGKDWTTDLAILARGDFNRDGAEDVLIRTVSSGSEGSWSEVRLRLLTIAAVGSVLEVVKDYPL